MGHDGDGADALLVARGDYARLLAKYEPIIIGRSVARLQGRPDAEDVAQDAKLRLFRELWKKIVEAVRSRGLSIGVSARLPPREKVSPRVGKAGEPHGSC